MEQQQLRYQGYLGSVEYSDEDCTFHGKILEIKDVVTYEAVEGVDLQMAFEEAVDDYIETLKESGK